MVSACLGYGCPFIILYIINESKCQQKGVIIKLVRSQYNCDTKCMTKSSRNKKYYLNDAVRELDLNSICWVNLANKTII